MMIGQKKLASIAPHETRLVDKQDIPRQKK